MTIKLIAKHEFDKTKFVYGTDIGDIIETAKPFDVLAIKYTSTDPTIIDKLNVFYNGDDEVNIDLFIKILRGEF